MQNSLDSYSSMIVYDSEVIGRRIDGAFMVEGDCCAPDILEGDAVLIAFEERPQPGEYAMLKARNECGSRLAQCVCDFGTFIEYKTNGGGFYSFDNQQHLIGRVLGVVRDGETIPLMCETVGTH